MGVMKKWSCLVAITAILALSVPAEARLLSNMLASNMLASNKLAGDGAFTDVSAIEFPNGIRFTR
jgi:hypothetical protein